MLIHDLKTGLFEQTFTCATRSNQPSFVPSSLPTVIPTETPSTGSNQPSFVPSSLPTVIPTETPSTGSNQPSFVPSNSPTVIPTETPNTASVGTGVVVGVSVFVVLLLVAATVGFYCFCVKISKRKKLLAATFGSADEGTEMLGTGSTLEANASIADADIKLVDIPVEIQLDAQFINLRRCNLLIPFGQLQNVKLLSTEGAFGEVLSASWFGQNVVMKIEKGWRDSSLKYDHNLLLEKYRSMLREVQLCNRVNGHACVVRLLGVCLELGACSSPCMVLERMKCGAEKFVCRDPAGRFVLIYYRFT
jgi:hypothetical protein